MVERSANVRGGECRVAYVQNSTTLGNFGYGVEICQGQSGISGRLAEDEFGVGLNGIFDIFWIGEIDKAEGHSQGDELFAADAIGAAVAAIGDDTMIASIHEGVDARCRCCHTRADANGIVAVFNLGHFLLEHFDRGVVGATVAESLLEIFVHGFLNEGGAEIDGSKNGARFFIGADAAMDDMGIEGTVGDPIVGFNAEGPDVVAIAAAGIDMAHPWRRCRAEGEASGYFLGEHFYLSK